MNDPMGTAPGTRAPIVVLLGGPSAEHDVSITSGTAIAGALADRGWAVRTVMIDLDGGWWWLPPGDGRDRPPTSASAYDEPGSLGADGPHDPGAGISRIAAMTPAPVVFVALHGPFGEDGVVQGMLEGAGIVYTGSGVAASALAMDKALVKRLWRGLGLPVPDWREIRSDRWQRDPDGVLGELDAFAAANGDARLMIKPARLGSSVGMTLAHTPAERGPALSEAFRFDTLAVVERYLAGARDLEVAVLGNDPASIETYGPGEIVAGHEFYDYEAKYTPGLSESTTHAEVDARMRAGILKLARDAYRSVGAEGFARIDFLLAGSDLYLSEINTIPGFTPISLFPTLAAEGGYDFGGVCERIVALALERQAGRVGRRLATADLPR